MEFEYLDIHSLEGVTLWKEGSRGAEFLVVLGHIPYTQSVIFPQEPSSSPVEGKELNQSWTDCERMAVSARSLDQEAESRVSCVRSSDAYLPGSETSVSPELSSILS